VSQVVILNGACEESRDSSQAQNDIMGLVQSFPTQASGWQTAAITELNKRPAFLTWAAFLYQLSNESALLRGYGYAQRERWRLRGARLPVVLKIVIGLGAEISG
jgi:hypothetical protein